MIGHADSGNVPEQEFFFPASGDKPAVTVRARSLDEAMAKFEGSSHKAVTEAQPISKEDSAEES